jgi:Xaa-Pro aminopeptidase
MFAATIYSQRRRVLAQRLAADGAQGLVLLLGHVDSPMNYADNAYDFRQDASFAYYAGLAQPGLALTIDLGSGEATLFADDASIDHLVWTGPLPTAAERAAQAGIEHTRPRAQLADAITQARAQGRRIHTLPAYRGETRIELAALLDVAMAALHTQASEPLLRAVIDQRAVKAPEEIAQIEDALAVTREMHLLAMRSAKPGVVEQEIVGAMEGLALARGRRMAYAPIFSSRGEILHNHDHGVRLKGGEMIVNDAGANSPEGYASDITRTIAVGGRFGGLQAEVYDLVLAAQAQAIAAAKAGVPYRQVHQVACEAMARGMQELGFLRGDPLEAVAAGAHAIFFPHGTGHMLGLDVHDMESLGEDRVGYGEGFRRATRFGDKSLRLARALQPGWVVTIEPGIYINPILTNRWKADGLHTGFIDYAMFDKHAGLGGIRIEDDVLITPQGPRVLGPAIPKERAEVEAIAAA